MTIYRFYDKKALQKEKLEKLKYRFGISGRTYDELLFDKNTNSELLYLLLAKSNTFDIVRNDDPEYDYGCRVFENTDPEILSALYYDREYHPDEVIFITTDQKTADQANLYFGDDSISVI